MNLNFIIIVTITIPSRRLSDMCKYDNNTLSCDDEWLQRGKINSIAEDWKISCVSCIKWEKFHKVLWTIQFSPILTNSHLHVYVIFLLHQGAQIIFAPYYRLHYSYRWRFLAKENTALNDYTRAFYDSIS